MDSAAGTQAQPLVIYTAQNITHQIDIFSSFSWSVLQIIIIYCIIL